MAAVAVSGTFTGTSSFRGEYQGGDVRLLTGDLMSSSVFALHIGSPNKIYITQGGVAKLNATLTDIQSLQRLLNSTFSGA